MKDERVKRKYVKKDKQVNNVKDDDENLHVANFHAVYDNDIDEFVIKFDGEKWFKLGFKIVCTPEELDKMIAGLGKVMADRETKVSLALHPDEKVVHSKKVKGMFRKLKDEDEDKVIPEGVVPNIPVEDIEESYLDEKKVDVETEAEATPVENVKLVTEKDVNEMIEPLVAPKSAKPLEEKKEYVPVPPHIMAIAFFMLVAYPSLGYGPFTDQSNVPFDEFYFQRAI